MVDVCRDWGPDEVIEIGTSYGASTRAWLYAGVPKVICIDQTFAAPEGQAEYPAAGPGPACVCWSRRWIAVHLGQLAAVAKRPLIFFDCHGAANMRYVLGQLSGLRNYCFVVDDMWYSEVNLDEWESQTFCKMAVEPEIDTSLPKSLWPQSYANYWAGGAFYSFDEVVPLLQYVNGAHIELEHRSKEAWWRQQA